MTKRRAAGAAAAVLLGLTAVCALLLRSVRPDTVTEANVARIDLGMTLAEVEAVFGRPSDTTGWTTPTPPGTLIEGFAVKEPCEVRYWFGPAHYACVLFGPDGKAVWKRWGESNPEPWYRRLADMLGL
jgi:hypothetical protein